MLNPAAPHVLSRHRSALLKPGIALRATLAVAAIAYVLGPTLFQWISFDSARAEVAALRQAEAPIAITADPEVSAEVQSMFEDAAPDEIRPLVGPGLAAVGTVHEGAADLGSMVLSAAIRAAQLAMVAAGALIVAMRFTLRYRSRHGAGLMATLLGRRG